MRQYPEHDKLEKVRLASQGISEFLEWLDDECEILPVDLSIQELLDDYFGIDRSKLGEEKQRMLRSLEAE
jgi:hypothetical protein